MRFRNAAYLVHSLERLFESTLTQPRTLKFVLPQKVGVAEDEINWTNNFCERSVRSADDTARPDDVESNLSVQCPIAWIVEDENSADGNFREIYGLLPNQCI